MMHQLLSLASFRRSGPRGARQCEKDNKEVTQAQTGQQKYIGNTSSPVSLSGIGSRCGLERVKFAQR
jgi:hypothetical protein